MNDKPQQSGSEQPKSTPPQQAYGPTQWWAKQLDDIDREILRLALACDARVLQPGVIDRIIRNDSSVCGSANPRAFDKLRLAVMMHYAVFEKSVAAVGAPQAAQIVRMIVTRLAAKVGRPLPNDARFADDPAQPRET